MPQPIPHKQSNRARIARYILHHKEASRQQLSQELGLSMPTVLQAATDLLDSGILCESGVYQSRGGRKARALSVNAGFRYAAGIDVTANHISYLLLGLDGSMIAADRARCPFAHTPSYWERVVDGLQAFLRRYPGAEGSLLGVGVSLPGIVDSDRSLLNRSHLLHLENVSLKDLEQRIPYPVRFFNDANSAAYAELVGSSRDAVYLLLSNSVGGAIYYHQAIVVGDCFKSAEFGHMILEKGGRRCYCGKDGCLDAYCSALRLTEGLDERLEDFFARLQEGEPVHKARWDEYLDYLAVAVSNLRMAFDCDIVLGGYVGPFLAADMGELGRRVRAYNKFESDSAYLKACRYPQEAAAVGGALAFVEEYIESLP